jgi:uncharacterized protein YukJ
LDANDRDSKDYRALFALRSFDKKNLKFAKDYTTVIVYQTYMVIGNQWNQKKNDSLINDGGIVVQIRNDFLKVRLG